MPRLRIGMCAALTKTVYTALYENEIRNVADLASANLERIARITNASYKDLIAVRRVLLAQFSSFPVNGADLYDDLLNTTNILSTGSQSLDKILDGGFYTGEVTELIGSTATGKTQVCLSTAIQLIIEGGNVVYFDTNNCVDIARIVEMLAECSIQEKDLEEVCSHFQHRKVFDIFELFNELEEVKDKVSKQNTGFYGKLRLVILDSIPGAVSSLIGGLHTDGLVYLMQLAKLLHTLAFDHSIAILITNYIVYNEKGETNPSLGKAWREIPNIRLEMSHLNKNSYLSNPKSCERSVKLIKSGRQKIGKEARIVISAKGIE